MYDTFNRYAWPNGKWPKWGDLDPARPGAHLIPDSILSVFHEGLRETIPQVDLYALNGFVFYVDQPGHYSIHDGQDFITKVMRDIKPLYGDMVERDLTRRGNLKVRFGDSCRGLCDIVKDTGPTIFMWSDGSINWPIIGAHETGHFIEFQRPDGMHPRYGDKNVCELQSFVVQNAAYEVLVQLDESKALKTRARRLQHSMHSYHGIIMGQAGRAFIQGKTPAQATLDIMQDWNLDAASAKRHVGFIYEEAASKDVGRADDVAMEVHLHCFAEFMAITLHDRLRGFLPEKRAAALHALYETEHPNLRQVLETFGLVTLKDIREAGRDAGRQLARDYRVLQPYLASPERYGPMNGLL